MLRVGGGFVFLHRHGLQLILLHNSADRLLRYPLAFAQKLLRDLRASVQAAAFQIDSMDFLGQTFASFAALTLWAP